MHERGVQLAPSRGRQRVAALANRMLDAALSLALSHHAEGTRHEPDSCLVGEEPFLVPVLRGASAKEARLLHEERWLAAVKPAICSRSVCGRPNCFSKLWLSIEATTSVATRVR